MDLKDCYFILRYDENKDALLKSLKNLKATVEKIPLTIKGGGSLYVGGGNSYIEINPKLALEVDEVQISNSEKNKITDLGYSKQKGYLDFIYNGITIHINLRSKERELE
ncbi:MAG: hypothetical protein AABX55_00945, partial [Nanoarchaeota archaeon]